MSTIKISGESLRSFSKSRGCVHTMERGDEFTVMKVKELKQGEYFKLSPNGRVYVRGYYERSERKYECYLFDDVNHETFLRGYREVIVGFDF